MVCIIIANDRDEGPNMSGHQALCVCGRIKPISIQISLSTFSMRIWKRRYVKGNCPYSGLLFEFWSIDSLQRLKS